MKRSLKIFKFFFAMFALAITIGSFLPGAEGIFALTIAAPLVLASLKTSDDAKKEKHDILKRMDEMIHLRKKEQRTFTDEEQNEYNEHRDNLKKLNDYIDQLMDEEKRALEIATIEVNKRKAKNPGRYNGEEKDNKEIREKYSFAKIIKAGIEGRSLDGLEAEMAKEAEKEARQSGISVGNYAIPDLALRAMSATGQTSNPLDQGGMMIETEKSGLLMALEDRMVLRSLGTQYLTGLVGNLEKPGIGAVTSAWEGEVDETADGSPITSQKKMEPHRLATTVIFSKQLKHQTNYNIENVLRDLIYKSVAGKLENTAINGGGSNEPDGLLSESDIAAIALGATGANPTWAKLVELETKVAENNADVNALAYLTNSKVRGFMKSTLKSSGVAGYLMDGDGRLNGYNVGVTNYVPSNLEKSTSGTILSAILFGNFNDLVIGQWAGMDLTFDDKTLARKAQDQMTVNTWWDVLVQRAESFAKIIDADTTIS